MNESGHIVNFSGEKENIEGQTRFTKPPEKTITNKVPKKVKFSSRSFALVKKATLKIKESLAKKMEEQQVKLTKQYQEAHETVKKAAQEESHKNKKEYDQIKLQVLTDELKSIGVKLILTDYVTTRLSVQGQSRAIKMPNFWQNIKRILSTVNMVNREFKDIGRSYGYGGIDRGNEGLDNMHKIIFGGKDPVQPKAPEQTQSEKIASININNAVPPAETPVINPTPVVNATPVVPQAPVQEEVKPVITTEPVEPQQIEKPSNQTFIPSEAKEEERKTADNLNALMEDLVKRYRNGINQSTVTTLPVVPTQEADTKVSTQPPIHYPNSTIGYTTEPKKEDSEKIPYNVSPEDYYRELYKKSIEIAAEEAKKRIATEKQLEEAKKELERWRGLSQLNPNFEGVVSPRKI